jgi:hypothetical protein
LSCQAITLLKILLANRKCSRLLIRNRVYDNDPCPALASELMCYRDEGGLPLYDDDVGNGWGNT